jgi:hypothetical protein
MPSFVCAGADLALLQFQSSALNLCPSSYISKVVRHLVPHRPLAGSDPKIGGTWRGYIYTYTEVARSERVALMKSFLNVVS